MEQKPEGEIRESGSIKASIVDISFTNPCLLFQEAFKALLKCLGFEDSSSSVSNTDSHVEATTTDDDPPTSTSVVVTTMRATNTRPKVNPGPGPKHN